METKTVYFAESNREATEATLNLTRARAQELGIKNVVVASTSGETAVRAVDLLHESRVIVVTHVAGMREANTQEFSDHHRELVESKGGTVLTTAHAFSGISTAMRNKQNMYVLGAIIADTLRIFGQGTKVACEIALMAADAGLIRTDEDVIAIGGSGHGADTALVLRPVNSHRFFDLKVKEILCKPHL